LDLARGVALLVASYLAYWFAFTLAALAAPPLLEVVQHIEFGGSPSWWVVVLVSAVNPVAEEFLYLGFITNTLKSSGFQAALIAGILARASVHVYQGPIGVVSSIAFGLVFGTYYLRSGRIWPIVLAHGLADLVGLGRLAGAT
jgi:membrane protease YdiL (CAAX protease family)